MPRPIFEITRTIEDEELFLDALDQYGFEVVKNYAALPYNYRVQLKDPTLSTEQGLEILGAHFPFCEYDPMDGREEVARSDGPAWFYEPMDTWSREGRGLSGLPDWTFRYGHHWGVANQVTDTPTLRFKTMHEAAKGSPWNIEFLKQGNGVDYYILDTGVDRRHPVFDEFPWKNRVIWVDGGDEFYQTGTDDQNHGTGMASCGAGKTLGVAQMSRIFSAKGLDGNNSGQSSAIIDGINALLTRFLAEDRPGVMNNSWGSTSSTAFTAVFNAVIAAGLFPVASGGNEDTESLLWPAAYADTLSVGALDANMHPADFTNYSSDMNCWSSGRDVLQAWRGGTMGWGNGTSPAGGFASGIVCCLLEGYRKPTSQADIVAIRNHIYSLAQNLRDTSSLRYSSTPQRVICLPTGQIYEQIPGLGKLVAQKRHRLGGACLTRSRVRLGGIAVNSTEYIHPLVNQKKIPFHLFNPSPADVVDTSYFNMNKIGWKMRNHGYVNSGVAVETNFPNTRELGWSDDDGNLGYIPGRTTQAPSAYEMGTSSSTRMEQVIPPDLHPDSNPVHFDEIFTNLDFEPDFTGWTLSNAANLRTVGSNSTFPYSGTRFPEGINGVDSHFFQVGDLDGHVNFGIIDAGRAKGFISFARLSTGTSASATPDDQMQVRIYAVDAADADISTVYDSGVIDRHPIGVRVELGFGASFTLPALTRKLRLRVDYYFNAGSTLNTAIDGISGMIYEATDQGDRMLQEIERGNAFLHHYHVRRSFNIDSDDQGRPQIFFTDGNGTILDTMTVEWTSPHNWTGDSIYHRIPQGTKLINMGIEGNLRAGSVINYWHRDHQLNMVVGQRSRRLVGKSKAVVRSKPIVRHVSGFSIANHALTN